VALSDHSSSARVRGNGGILVGGSILFRIRLRAVGTQEQVACTQEPDRPEPQWGPDPRSGLSLGPNASPLMQNVQTEERS